ncbi:MAG TPA: extracellular solute-binding protein [Hyphomicrobiaceae bacterium]|nr:extracellular solute-binding protein [Hyphomicrobiaceae bacterium]
MRTTPLFAAAGAAIALALALSGAATAEPRHGLSTFGELKYPAGFSHFEYVNPSAPKGGRISLVGSAARLTFDSFNPWILRGDAAQGLELLYDSLMAGSGDEPDALYGLVAESADIAADRMSIVFRLREAARFSDGSPVTADDVVFTFNILKEKGHPSYRINYRDVTKAEAVDRLTVRFQFQGELVRDLPLMVAGLPVLPKAYYDTQPFEETTLKPPVGSGPYVIGDFQQGAFVTYKRRADYWARDLNVNRGRFNFDEIRYEYFRDRTTALEALKAGNFDYREEFTARDWSTGYDIPAVREGRLVKLELPNFTPSGAQGWFPNLRREKFHDPRIRRAMALAFDFEWTNKNLFYNLYTRTESYFENSDMKAMGPPTPAEIALLEPFRAKLPPEVFGEPYRPAPTDGSGADRRNLREAQKLLNEAGWKLDGKSTPAFVRNAKGETLDIEFLGNEPTFERILGPYVKNLQAIGINASIRRIDTAQYERRVKSYDYDVVSARHVMSLTPGIELRNYFSSESARMEGTRNLGGIADPVIDALIETVIKAKSRDELVTAARAMDRVLRAGHYWVPHWYKASHHLAFWDKFGRPATKAKYALGVLDTWWFDPEKAVRVK